MAEPHLATGKSYPVWVGCLKDSVTDSNLEESFCFVGGVVSCKVMVDERGKSRGFGYVNFRTKEEAEEAARVMNGYPLAGSQIRTKGPVLLKKEGHFETSKIKPNSPDYRPYTDCSFFMLGSKCKKGKTCPYRHSNAAMTSPTVCAQWLEKSCLNVDCPYKHPGGGGKTKDQAVMVPINPNKQLYKCGGKCGDTKCSALFLAAEDLTKHIDPTRMPQCRHCKAIFPSPAEYQDHLQTCWARTSTTSTELSSDSQEVEVRPDSDTEEDEEVLGGVVRPYSSVQVQEKGKCKKKRSGDQSGTSGDESRLFNGQHARNLSGSDDLNLTPYSSQFYMGRGAEGGQLKFETPPYETSSNSYFSAYSESEEESDEEDEIVQYSVGEMARLLSLNEQDMLESSADEDNDDATLAAKKAAIPHTSIRSPPKSRKRPGIPEGEREGESSSSPTTAAAAAEGVKQVSTSTHKLRLEPVGVFWDIENCPVPVEKSAFGVAAKMRSEFITGKREAEFMCVCDITKERKEVTDELHKAQVTLVHVNAIAKNAADDKLRQSLRRFAHTYPAPATVVLISGDVNFSMELNDLIHLHNITVVLVHNSYAAEALKAFANQLICYDEFIKDVAPPSQQQQNVNLPRVVLVSGLPPSIQAPRIKNRLDRISDNCGGKVLNVNTNSHTARVLFRTNEWAKKALKRMHGEDVFGYKINTAMESPTPSQQQQHHSMKRLVGPDLNKSFPPAHSPQRPPNNAGGLAVGPGAVARTPPLNHRPPPPIMGPPMPRPLLPPPHPRGGMPPPLMNQFPPPRGPPRPLFPGPPQPLPRPPMLPAPSTLPPPPPGFSRFPRPPNGNPQHLPRGAIPRPEGKILIFKIPPHEEPVLHENVHRLQANAFLSAEVMILWHSYAELQVVLRLDFMQTAIIRKEEIVHTLYERGELNAEVAAKFVETCTKSVMDVLRRCHLTWDATTCGWSTEEEENRIVRSNVIALLRRNPTCWTKFSNFKKRYFNQYSTAISEMTIHNACRGAVQILSDQNKSETQVIIFYEYSPLLKILNNQQLHVKLKSSFHQLLSRQPERKIKLLDFVTTYHNAQLGPLPTSSSGKMLQEIITSMPHVTLVGSKPSNIYVTLGAGSGAGAISAEAPAAAPHNLAGISAAFIHLLDSRGKEGIPYKNFQHEYQSFFHHSFRVSEYLPGEQTNGVKKLIEACHGVKLETVELPDGRKEERVVLDPQKPAAATTLPPHTTEQPLPPSSGNGGKNPAAKPTAGPEGGAPSSLVELSASFRKMISAHGENGISLKRFQPEYQTFFHHSFRVSDYLPGDPNVVGVKELVQVCPGIKVVSFDLPNGKKEERVCLDSGPHPSNPLASGGSSVLPPVSRSNSSAQTSTLGAESASTVSRSSSSPNFSASRFAQLNTVAKRPTTLEEIASDFRRLLLQFAGKLPLKRFQQEYQTFFHHSFRVSTFLPGDVGLRDLLINCQGIKIVNIQLPNSKFEEHVCLDTKPPTKAASSSVDSVGSSAAQKLPAEAVRRFKSECIEVLSSVPGRALPLLVFPEQYLKIKKEQFLLANYKAKKIVHLVEAIPDVVQIVNDSDTRIIKLISQKASSFSASSSRASKADCEKEIEALLYQHPKCTIRLDRFMAEYEKTYSRRLNPQLYGCPKLLKLLEQFPNTIVITGGGVNRPIVLHPNRVFACELTELLACSSGPMPINKIVPAYKEKFGRDFVVSRYGHVKLIKALEAIPDVINIRGNGASRTVTLKPPSRRTSVPTVTRPQTPAAATPSSLPKPHLLVDELTAILKTTHSQRMSLVDLAKGYNQAFRANGQQPRVEGAELGRAIDKLPNFKVTGSGPLCYVQLIQSPKVDGSKQPSTSQMTSDPSPSSSPQATRAKSDSVSSDTMPKLIGVTVTSKKTSTDTTASNVPKPLFGDGDSSPRGVIWDEEARRLCSETRRILLCHPEHAMTLTELAEHFCSVGDPTRPTSGALLNVLKKQSADGVAPSTERKFEISHFPNDTGASLVQLNRQDCLWKLGEDLLHLFEYQPTATLSLPVSSLEALYAQCFSRRLVLAVYAAKDIHQVLRAKVLKKVIQVEGSQCTPCKPYREQVLANLLIELLYVRGDECPTLKSLPKLYQDHFKAPLPLSCVGAVDVPALMQLHRVKDGINLVNVTTKKVKAVLKPPTVFVEQLRHLLTKYGGRVALDQLEALHTAEFGESADLDVQRYLKKKLPHFCFHVVNLASHRWAVWAPVGHPHNPERVKVRMSPQTRRSESSEGTNARGSITSESTMVNVQETADITPSNMEKVGDDSSEATPTFISTLDKSASFVNDLTDLSETAGAGGGDEGEGPGKPEGGATGLDFSILDDLGPMEWPDISTEPSSEHLIDMPNPPLPAGMGEDRQGGTQTSQNNAPLIDYSSMPALDPPPEATIEGSGAEGSTELAGQTDETDSPYDFLKDHPELIAELSKGGDTEEEGPGNEDLRILAEVLMIQRLQDLGLALDDLTFPPLLSTTAGSGDRVEGEGTPTAGGMFKAEDLPTTSTGGVAKAEDPPTTSTGGVAKAEDPPTTGGVAEDSHVTETKTTAVDSDKPSTSSGAEAVPVPPPNVSSTSTTGQPPDFLQMGLNPMEVMGELQSLKEQSGGSLRPDQMEPFLDYFGEMSSRELERMEAREGKPPSKPKKGGAGSRVNMAIRFPSQSQPAKTSGSGIQYPSYEVTVPPEKLPVADFTMSDSSDDDDDAIPVPLDSEEYIRRVLSGDNPSRK